MYTNDAKILIENVQVIGDLKNTIKKVSNFGAPQTASLQWMGYINASRFIEHDLVCRIMVDKIRIQFREFYRKLQELSREKGSRELSSLAILSKFLPSKGTLR